jgi:hypothetical protein
MKANENQYPAELGRPTRARSFAVEPIKLDSPKSLILFVPE